jgi:periplasmic divalent cation tolerance protein
VLLNRPLSSEVCIIFTTTDNPDVSKAIIESLLEQKLCACIQVDKVESHYLFEGQKRNVDEYRLNIKALSSNYHDIEQLILQIHNYKVPEILCVEVKDGFPDYINWVKKN